MSQHTSHAAGLRVAIVGASLGGVSVANVLHRFGA
jgi:2-polyprenyl-6-methoxyphenol hydroxylase-like FAD-dependent oxidoreductase